MIENKHIIQLVGCLMIWLISINMIQTTRLNNIFCHFGKYSLQYYLNHQLIIVAFYWLIGKLDLPSPWLSWFLIFFAATFASYCMLKIEKQFKITQIVSGLKNENS